MGKGYNNYMTKKPFHPGSKANIKRTWMAEQRTENEKRKQDELKTQYEKEQDLYSNKALLSTECKDKLELNFMYEAPPGAKRERQKEDDEPEYKFEWQRKYNAPREDYAKGNADIRDQPFGIPVRNVRCIKCHKWGHINTDRECPLFSQSSASSMPSTSMDPLELMRQMKEDGLNLKQSALSHHLNLRQSNQELIPSDESDPEMDFLKSLSAQQKRKLLKKLNKLSKKQSKKNEEKKRKKAKKQESLESESDDPKCKKKLNDRWSSLDSDSPVEEIKMKKKVKKSKDKKEAGKRKKHNRDESGDEEKIHKKSKSEASTSKQGLESDAKSLKEVKPRVEFSHSPLHPDGFSHRHPQRNSGKTEQQHGTLGSKFHGRFRDDHRSRRSPSVKHKYRK